ncbi:hypothetical protein [Desertivirga xinjiangensis]|uniref:hypothetical protein n=1 Tax=Desertivirga xinjiangensis TaxID=539206 RepID=UPI00210CDC7A|nr:hypothetical protein [Pedobacter xinjiangensis]
MKKSYLIIFVAVLSAFASCKKDDETEKISDSYYPVSKGTERTYKQSSGGSSSIYIETFTGNTVTYNQETYYEAVTTTPNSNEIAKAYYFEGNGVYKLRATTYVNGIDVQFTYLNERSDVGSTWTSNITASGQINGVPARMVGEIKEKNISKQVLGKTYDDVIHSTVQLQYNTGNGFETASTYEFYTARGIGVIEVDTKIDYFGLKLDSKTELQNYTIK